MLLKFIPLIVILCLCDAIIYDRYTAEPASEELIAYFESAGLKDTCTMEVADCDPTERRRVDGSCNNLDNPVRGTYFEPVYRVLDAVYYNGSYPKKSIDGSELELPKVIRNTLLAVGKAINLNFTQALPSFGIFTFGDVASIHDFVQFLQNKTDCCTPEGMNSRGCSPIYVPKDDPTHRWTGIRCLNLTTPLVYSDYGCTNDTKPSPVETATATFDMSHIYNLVNNGDKVIRSYDGGQLTVDVDDDGIIWPPNGNNFCIGNQPGETRCFANYPTALLTGMLLGTWMMRQHNFFATELAAVNPCWDDETLFQTARDINIAFVQQVYFYEWATTAMGYKNLVEAGVISDNPGFRDVYDSSTYPQVSLEYTYGLRWFHTIQETTANMYDVDGNFLKAYPYVNVTFRPGFLGIDQNIVKFTQHIYRQRTSGIDFIVDPDISQNGLALLQRSVDVTASDLYKSRLLGFPPYVDYVEYCTGHTITCFDDLSQHMEPERIELLKTVYKYVGDVDFLAGMWSEKLFPGGSIPATLACIIIEFLKRAVRYDRHWYERADRPYAFNKAQLAEIRKSSLALMMCNVADGVSVIQPQAFRAISSENPLTACKDIPKIDFNAWADATTTDSTSDDSTNGSSSRDSSSNDTSTSDDSTNANSSSTSSSSGESTSDDSTNASSSSDSSSSAESTSDDSTNATSSSPSTSSDDSTNASSSSASSSSAESTSDDSTNASSSSA